MKKQMLKSALIALAGVGLMSGSALADAINSGRPYDSGNLDYIGGVYTPGGNEVSLQTIFNDKITNGLLDAINDQSSAGLWQQTDGGAQTYLVSLLTAGSDNLYIYSSSTNEIYTLNSVGVTSASFTIDNGQLWYGTTLIDATFGNVFGFAYGSSYTEDSKNGGDIKALSYLLTPGMKVTTKAFSGSYVFTAQGGDDWILAFEDGSDNDFQDAVFVVEDMEAVPEPATMLLFGTGIVSLAGFARRKKA